MVLIIILLIILNIGLLIKGAISKNRLIKDAVPYMLMASITLVYPIYLFLNAIF